MRMRLEDLPVRLATGAFMVNSGVGKLSADEERAAGLHEFASGTYPFLSEIPPDRFTHLLARAEIGLGIMLLNPLVPSRVAGTALTAFAGGLLGLYMRTPGMRQDGSLRPTEQGLPLSKDVWLLGAGLTLTTTDLRRSRVSRKKK
jgi:uncharacterized membrane protein YphA (DoxX/SURF4 family)